MSLCSEFNGIPLCCSCKVAGSTRWAGAETDRSDWMDSGIWGVRLRGTGAAGLAPLGRADEGRLVTDAKLSVSDSCRSFGG